MFKIAFYKGPETWIGKLIRWWDNGAYSHVELSFSDGLWGTAFTGQGVILRPLAPVDGQWDYIELPDHLEAAAREWFKQHEGKSYDYFGLARFVFDFLKPSRDKWFCSRACSDALGLVEGWREGPNGLHAEVLNALVM